MTNAISVSAEDFDFVRKLVFDRSAIVLEPGKEYLVESRILPLVKKENYESIAELVSKIRADISNGLNDRVVDALTTNETSFFRDVHPFEVIKNHVIPQMMEKRASLRELNIWFAASSSGQEPFSVAMLLRENFPELLNWKLNMTASDISPEMLERCKAGKFSQLEVNRGLPAPLLVKYFSRQGMDWLLNKDILDMIEFRQINLAQNFPFLPAMDVIMIRNVLIYFDIETKISIFGKIKNLIKPDGFLFLGAAETTLNLDDDFQRNDFKRSGCYQLKNR